MYVLKEKRAPKEEKYPQHLPNHRTPERQRLPRHGKYTNLLKLHMVYSNMVILKIGGESDMNSKIVLTEMGIYPEPRSTPRI